MNILNTVSVYQRIIIVSFLYFLLMGCAGAMVDKSGKDLRLEKVENSDPAPLKQWNTIAVAPFAYSDHLKSLASLWLSFRLSSQKSISIINEAKIELILRKHGYYLSTKAEIDVDKKLENMMYVPVTELIKNEESSKPYQVAWFTDRDLQAIGNIANVDAVVTGYIYEQFGPIIIGLKMVDTESGKVVHEVTISKYWYGFDYIQSISDMMDIAAMRLIKEIIPENKITKVIHNHEESDEWH